MSDYLQRLVARHFGPAPPVVPNANRYFSRGSELPASAPPALPYHEQNNAASGWLPDLTQRGAEETTARSRPTAATATLDRAPSKGKAPGPSETPLVATGIAAGAALDDPDRASGEDASAARGARSPAAEMALPVVPLSDSNPRKLAASAAPPVPRAVSGSRAEHTRTATPRSVVSPLPAQSPRVLADADRNDLQSGKMHTASLPSPGLGAAERPQPGGRLAGSEKRVRASAQLPAESGFVPGARNRHSLSRPSASIAEGERHSSASLARGRTSSSTLDPVGDAVEEKPAADGQQDSVASSAAPQTRHAYGADHAPIIPSAPPQLAARTQAAPSVAISIGTVELRAAAPSPPPAAPARSAPRLSLDEYLRRRGERGS